MWKKPVTFTPITVSKSSWVNSVNGLETNTPALLTSVSIRPNRSRPAATTRSAVARSAMSP